MHDDDRHAVLGDHARHVGIALQAPHVVDDAAPAASAQAATCGLHGVDRDRHAEPGHRGQHRLEPPHFLARRDRRRGAVGPGGFRADVDDVRALRDHAAGVLDGGAGSRKRPPSENESGVTLRMPITSGRPGPSSRASGPNAPSAARGLWETDWRAKLMAVALRRPGQRCQAPQSRAWGSPAAPVRLRRND